MITTRTPLHIELCPVLHSSETCVFVNDNKFELPYNSYRKEHLSQIIDSIVSVTDMYTNNTFNISKRPILVKIFYIDIPHLYLIDLPGLTLVARTDEGQPKDIKDQTK